MTIMRAPVAGSVSNPQWRGPKSGYTIKIPPYLEKPPTRKTYLLNRFAPLLE